MEQYLYNLSTQDDDADGQVVVRPNVWLMTADEIPPILFTPEEVARLLGISRCRVFDLIRQRELASVKVGALRRVSARAVHEYVGRLELEESA
jgi:excisionase family DNA binding protein